MKAGGKGYMEQTDGGGRCYDPHLHPGTHLIGEVGGCLQHKQSMKKEQGSQNKIKKAGVASKPRTWKRVPPLPSPPLPSPHTGSHGQPTWGPEALPMERSMTSPHLSVIRATGMRALRITKWRCTSPRSSGWRYSADVARSSNLAMGGRSLGW